jgi:hypothetical protein
MNEIGTISRDQAARNVSVKEEEEEGVYYAFAEIIHDKQIYKSPQVM